MPDERKRFKEAYDGGCKPWDSGVPSAELIDVEADGRITGLF